MAARTTRTSEEIRAEIEQTFGFFPPFFEPALPTPQVLENLWQQTLSSYIQNPFSALFKEKLNAVLSRFCAAPYCMIVHSAALRPLGMTARQVLALLETPFQDQEAELPLGRLPVLLPEEAAAPTPDSVLEKTLLYCATAVFLEQANAEACQRELSRLLRPELYSHLVMYLAYIKTCHLWIESHPEVSYEADQRAQDNLGPLLAEEPALADFFRNYQAKMNSQRLGKNERKAANDALRSAEANTARILESITDAFYAVDAEFRFTHINSHAEKLWRRSREELLGVHFLEGLPQMKGSAAFAQYQKAMSERVPSNFEALSPVIGRWLSVNVNPTDNGGLSVFFRDITERRAMEEQQASLAERERNIAQQLQAALQPELPDALPGLAVTKYYEAALAEAGVGGDFYDVFSVNPTCTALVVGDLSGKGLDAAALVATVRNMLRAFVYTKPTLAEAVTELNEVLAGNNLLTGFCTLFISVFDTATGILTYVNCGQEPALVRRAGTGAVEPLDATGPILGTFQGAVFSEGCVALRPLDAVAIFTDGLTEVGPSRTGMLGVEGISSLLAEPFAQEEAQNGLLNAEALALRLIVGVDAAAANGVTRDDMCLLIAVAE